jgi:ferredoxin
VKEGYRAPEASRKNLKRFILYIGLIPVLTLLGGWIGFKSHIYLSRVHPDVYLAELMISQPELREDEENLDIQAFLESGETFEQLVDQAAVKRDQFRNGGWALGGFIGLALGITLMNQVVFRRKEDYQPHRGDCFSCGRCMDYCPVDKKVLSPKSKVQSPKFSVQSSQSEKKNENDNA